MGKKRIPKIKKYRQVEQVRTEVVAQAVEKDAKEPLKELSRRNTHRTPDFLELKTMQNIPVFVYGTLKKGNNLHEVLADCPCLGRGVTSMPRFDMRNNPNSSFPVVFPVSDTATFRAKIQGEIYLVDAMRMLDLDAIESNGSMYTRKEVFIKFIDQTYTTNTGPKSPQIKCWMYLGNMDYWEHYQMPRPPYSSRQSSVGVTENMFDWQQAKMMSRSAH